MKIEYVLLGIIAIVFLIDFLKKKNKKSNSEIIKGFTKPKRKALIVIKIFFFLILGLIIGISINLTINSHIYSSKYDPLGNFANENYFNRLIKQTIYDESGLLNLIIGLSISIVIFILSSRNKFISYVVKRKKNLTLSIILIPLLKILMHYFLYPERTRSSRNSPTRIKSFGDHINMIFDEHLELFIPSLFLVLFFAWFLNDKIKAK